MASPWLSRHAFVASCLLFVAIDVRWIGLRLPEVLLDPIALGAVSLRPLADPTGLLPVAVAQHVAGADGAGANFVGKNLGFLRIPLRKE